MNIVNCPVCKTEADDIRHILFSCSRAREVWSALDAWPHIEKLLIIDRSGSVLIQEIIRRGGEDTELILTGCWYIWWQRRQLVHGEDIQNPSRSAMSIVAITANYFTAAKKVTVINQGWRKPSKGYLMINIDGVLMKQKVREARVLSSETQGVRSLWRFIVSYHMS